METPVAGIDVSKDKLIVYFQDKYYEFTIVFFIIAATGAKSELMLVLVMGGCWAECAENLNTL